MFYYNWMLTSIWSTTDGKGWHFDDRLFSIGFSSDQSVIISDNTIGISIRVSLVRPNVRVVSTILSLANPYSSCNESGLLCGLRSCPTLSIDLSLVAVKVSLTLELP